MPNGVSAKGYKMTQNRKRILELLVSEGGDLKSGDGRATSLMHGLLDRGTSIVSLNASLRELEKLGFISRDIEGRRTYAISITDLGRSVIGAEEAPSASESSIEEPTSTDTDLDAPPVDLDGASVSRTEWDWQDEDTANGQNEDVVPEGIDYEILLGMFLKAAARGLERRSSSDDTAAEIVYYKQEASLASERLAQVEEELGRERAVSSQAIAAQDQFKAERDEARAERDQLEKNLKILMSRFEKKTARGGDSIRNLVDPETRSALDALMRSVPTRRGE